MKEITIKKLREKLGLTQMEFAEKLGVNVLTVRRWEKGYYPPSQIAKRLIKMLFKVEIK